MIFSKCSYKNVPCVFSEANHQSLGMLMRPNATWIGYHEFTNHPPKMVCDEHKRRIENLGKRKGVKK